MSDFASSILTGIFGLGTFVCAIYLLYLLAKEKGGAHAVLGFFFPPYPYVWGWIQSRRLEIVDVMIFWTVVSLAVVIFPLIMGFRSVANTDTFSVDPVSSSLTEDTILRGPIQSGTQVNGQIDDLFGIDEWTFQGSAGQTVTFWCAPVAGSDTDPRIKIIDPGGVEIASDDDGGDDRTAMISDLNLPSNGTYRILVDVWFTGPYLLNVQ